MQTDVIVHNTGKVIIKYVYAITGGPCIVNGASQAAGHFKTVCVETLHFHSAVVSCVSRHKNTTSATCQEREHHRKACLCKFPTLTTA